MSGGRQFGGAVYRGLKTATRQVLASNGPLKRAAAGSRIASISALQRFGSQSSECADRFMPIDVALDLMAASGDTALLEVMAFHLDLDLHPLATPVADPVKSAVGQITGLAELIADLSQVAADGKITAREIHDTALIADLTRVIKRAERLKTALGQIVFASVK